MNNYNAPGKYFDIDTGTVTVADLTALKSGAPASDDTLYISEGATVNVDANMSILKVYLGDNAAGTASTKTGHLIITASAASVTLTIYDTTANGGWRGEGSTSTTTLTGVSNSIRAIMAANTAAKVFNYDIPTCLISSSWGQFTNLYAINQNNANNSFTNTVFGGIAYGLNFAAGYVLPASLDGSSFVGCTIALRDNTTTTPLGWQKFLSSNEILITGNASGVSAISFNHGTSSGISRYVYFREDAASIQSAPAWNTTTGIQNLSANQSGMLLASWNPATHATGDSVKYRVYIRAGSAPDTFGIASTYFLFETVQTDILICSTPNGNELVNGTTYYIIVRACTDLSDEDTNTTSLSAIATTAADTIISQIKSIVGAHFGIYLANM